MDVRKTIDNVAGLLQRVHDMTTADVLVGIPQAKNPRADSPIGNAAIARVHEFGSPAHNIPARPFLFPGVRKAQGELKPMFKQGALDAMHGKGSVDVTLNRIGMTARKYVVNEITDPAPPFAPLQPATIRARLRRTQAGRRQLRKLKKTGQTVTNWAEAINPKTGSANIHPLIDTGKLRAAITYVVRKGVT